MKDLIALRKELDDAQRELTYVGQMNVADCVPIESRIATDQAYMRAQHRMTDAYRAYSAALAEAQGPFGLTSGLQAQTRSSSPAT